MVGLRTQKRRRRENKTDYKLRLNLLKSGIPRLVIRRTNKYFVIQAVESNESQDKVTLTVSSKDLLKDGLDKKFKGSLKSVTAGYLTGLKAAKLLDKTEYIIDFGVARTMPGNRLFAVVSGLVEGGANVRVSEKMFPSEERIKGEHLSEETKAALYKLKDKLVK